jgi:hypothetical protein
MSPIDSAGIYVRTQATAPEGKIWRFLGGHYEEYRLLGYRNPVRTSRRHITSLKTGVFWGVTPGGSCKN